MCVWVPWWFPCTQDIVAIPKVCLAVESFLLQHWASSSMDKGVSKMQTTLELRPRFQDQVSCSTSFVSFCCCGGSFEGLTFILMTPLKSFIGCFVLHRRCPCCWLFFFLLALLTVDYLKDPSPSLCPKNGAPVFSDSSAEYKNR